MPDNTTLNPGANGDTIRTVLRSGVKTQVVITLDALDDLGYQQMTTLSAATAPTIPSGTLFALIICSGQPVRWRSDGTNPTASVGMPLSIGGELKYDSADISSLKFIETAASATLDITYFGVA